MKELIVLEQGRALSFIFEDLMKYHGYVFSGGVAHSFQPMARAFPLLNGGEPMERREIELVTAITGPGGWDGFEMVTRCVSDGRFHVDSRLPEAAQAEESPGDGTISAFLTAANRWWCPSGPASYGRSSWTWPEGMTKPRRSSGLWESCR